MEQNNHPDPQTVRFVTANYSQLQGLRLVPMGLMVIVLGLVASGSLDWLPSALGVAPEWRARARLLTWTGFTLFTLMLLAFAAPVYYNWRYGSVQQFTRHRRNRWIGLAVLGYFVLRGVDSRLEWPLSLSLLVVSLSLFITVYHDGRVRSHYLIPAIIWLAFSFLPALDLSRGDARLAVAIVGGLTLIGCGIGDHLLLTRTLGRPGIGSDDGPQAAIV